MLLLSVYETFLYYCCLLLVCRFILNCSPKKFYLYGSFIAFIPLVLIAISGNNTLHHIAYVVFGICQFLLLKIIFTNIKLSFTLFSYLVLYALNVIMVSLVFNITALPITLVDSLINSITAILCCVVCLTNIRNKIRPVIHFLPRHFLLISSLLLVSTSIVSVLIFRALENTTIWNYVPALALSILQLAVCTVPLVLLFNILSNNHLKNLTANYEQQIEAQAQHYKELAAANYESRRFKHDFNNMQIAIKKLLADGDNDQALKLIQECLNTLENPIGFHVAFDTGNGIADALLTDKQQKASLCNAVIHFQGVLPQDSLLPTDLCVILGNTLDNAIEACQKLPAEVEKTIAITCNCSSGYVFLSICNPVAEKVIVNNNHIATTKENKTLHGFGLYSLNSVVKKYEGEVKLTSTDDYFTVDIDLCLKLDKSLVSALPS